MNIRVGNRTVHITHPEKIIFPHDHLRKIDLINYYYRVAPMMLPYMKNRLISMHRFVDGLDHPGFYQKDAGEYFPAWIKRYPLLAQDGHEVKYIAVNNKATLLYIVNQLCVTPHLWLSRVPHIDRPDRMVFDLDPSQGVSFKDVVGIARALHALFDAMHIVSFVMTTGSRGVHVVVALKGVWTFDQVRAYARSIAEHVVAMYPAKATVEIRKEKRGKRVFIDVTRNAYGQTTVAPYAVRARTGAPVATPVRWDELGFTVTASDQFTVYTIIDRVNAVGGLWDSMNSHAVSPSILKHSSKIL